MGNNIVFNKNSASHGCTDTIFVTLKCIFDGLIIVLFGADRVETPCTPKMCYLCLTGSCE